MNVVISADNYCPVWNCCVIKHFVTRAYDFTIILSDVCTSQIQSVHAPSMESTVTAHASVTLQTPSAVTKPTDVVTASQGGRALTVPRTSRNVQSLNVLYAGPMRTVKRLLDPIDAAVTQDIDGIRLVYVIVSI